MTKSVVKRLAVAAVALGPGAWGCASTPANTADSSARQTEIAAMTGLSVQDQRAGWRPLFDGRTLAGWRVYQSQLQPAGWMVQDGVLTKTKATEDIISVDQFGDFELALDWKVSRGGNAGLFYRATEEYVKVYWSATEYQLLDDPNARDGRNPLTSTGAAYGLYPAPTGVVKPAGEWNSTRVVARGAHVEHWLNGTKLLEYELWSSDWEAKVKASKFAVWPNYGRAKRGHIAFQGDHGGELSLRNIRIRELR
jgi:hypothetical protein